MLPAYNIFHAACHGIPDPFDPAQSHLRLFRQTTDPADDVRNIDKLTVSTISRITTSNSVLAFLSACSSAEVLVPMLLDEGLQIANAFQLAGFPHVIGTLWPAYDVVCPKVAEVFYGFLAKYTTNEPLTSGLIAIALQQALMSIRKDSASLPLKWAMFIHQGP